MTDRLRIAHLRIAPQWAILRWAILSPSVIRIAHPNYDTIFHPACFIKGGGYRFWVVLYVFVRFCQETAHNVATNHGTQKLARPQLCFEKLMVEEFWVRVK